MSDAINLRDVRLQVEEAAAEGSLATAFDAFGAAKVALGVAKEIMAEAKAAFCAAIERHGDLVVGDVRYYVGTDTSYKPKYLSRLLDRLLVESGGDLDRFAEFFSSDAVKPGEARSVLGDQFDDWFDTIKAQDVKTGKPKRGLKEVDSKFLPKKPKKAPEAAQEDATC